ncbi:hypothetical protein M5689_017880 [Euphorbia peplus]|nr:hypothetical protein M5689_017880 [Euphorbia peplus]
MASRGVIVQENSVGWNTNISKPPRKGMLGGRTPLGDLSNSLKPSLNQAAKKQNSGLFPLSETGASQNVIKKKGINAQASKKVQPSGRKALSDISNSGRRNLNEGSKKNSRAKLSVLAEEPIDANEVAGEQFLHNHKECIKAKARPMDLDLFLQTIGLDNDFSKQQASPKSYQSPPRHLQLEEMSEEPWKNKFCSELDSPPPLRSPKYRTDYDYKFELLASP